MGFWSIILLLCLVCSIFLVLTPPGASGASVAPRLEKTQLVALYFQNGFPPRLAETMAGLALRESGGDPRAFNARPPDLSYGLLQINLYGELGRVRLARFRSELGLHAPEDLFDPATNARAAVLIWGGDDRNLETAWPGAFLAR
jgi:hypothetical protein